MFFSKLLTPFKKPTATSKVNGQLRIDYSFGRKAVFVGEVPQSGGEYIQMWTRVINSLKQKNFQPKKCLMLGVAGGTAINVLRKNYPQILIKGVELDPVILDLSLNNHLFKKDSLTEIVVADALVWVKKDKQKYDLIVVDLYLADLNPPQARQKPFLLQVKKLLRPDGVVLYNCHYQKSQEADYLKFRSITDKIFSKVEEAFVYPKNKILSFRP